MDGKAQIKMTPERRRQETILLGMKANKFLQMYTMIADTKRELLVNFYRDNSVMVWNGHRLQGKRNLQMAFKALPTTQHKLEAVDVQPILPNEQTSKSFVVTVAGTIRYGAAEKVKVHQTFVLERNPDKRDSPSAFYILSHVLRDCLQRKT